MCKCIVCGKENYPVDTKKFPKIFCSYKCYEEWQKFNKTPNCKCVICGREMYLKPSRLKRVKNGITCSLECSYKLKSEHTIHHNHSKCVGVVKSGNIGEGCDANPEISSEITKGSEPSYSVEGE